MVRSGGRELEVLPSRLLERNPGGTKEADRSTDRGSRGAITPHSMKLIPLSQGKYAKVDDEDFEYLSQWKWYFNSGYAVRGCEKRILMHRIILETPDNLLTDHINRDKLDNRRSNLRVATKSLNNFNTKIRKDNTSGVKGIYWSKLHSKWRVTISKQKKRTSHGLYALLADAVVVRNRIENLLYG